MENRCVCCGSIVPEGNMVCHSCEHNTIAKLMKKNYSDVKDDELIRMLRRCGSAESCSSCEYSCVPDVDVCNAVLLQAADRLEALRNLVSNACFEVVCRG